MSRRVILGLGNRDRGDDGAGPYVIERLREAGVDARAFAGDSVALIDEWTSADDVVLVDACVSGADAGTVFEIGAGAEMPGRALSSHAIGAGQALELARMLGRMPRSLHVYAIEGSVFAHGAPLSDAVVRGCERVVRCILYSEPARIAGTC